MFYVTLVLAVSCAALCVALVALYRAWRSAGAARQRFSGLLDDFMKLVKAAEKSGDFSGRLVNPNLVPCWEALRCDKSDCPAHQSPNLRCWQTEGTACVDPQDQGVIARLDRCGDCPVLRRAMSDEVSRWCEQLNHVMASLERAAQLQNEARQHVQRAKQLASAGEFAAGIAHEINNPLDGIRSCVARLERDPTNLTQSIEYLKLIREALDRISRLVQHLLEYSRQRDLHIEATDVHGVLENVVALIKPAARQKAVNLEFYFDEKLPPVQGDRYFLAEAFLNLALNAMAATGPGGTLTFRTFLVHNEEGGDWAEVDVADTGVGIEPAHMPRVFDLFFTTKEAGQGTGLGLAIVKSIIEEHHGRIKLESTPGVGTTARVFLPIANGTPLVSENSEETTRQESVAV